MKRKLCCIFMLVIFLLNSSLMILISEAVDAIQTNLEEKVKALAEINLTKYENFDTTTENSDTGSKGVLVQFNLKTGIEFAEGEEYVPIQKTTTNIDLPWIGNYKPERVEVLTKSTQATNGGKEASYEYHASTGILSITAENNGYAENIANSRDEYEIICIYNSECYTNNQENDLKVQLITYEILNDEQETTKSNKVEQEYTCTDNINGVVSIEHKTDKVYDGYITANTLNSENKYDTTYNEMLRVMVSNKDIAQKIEVKENSETSLYTETSVDKNQVLDMLGDKGSIDVLDENGNVLKTINKDTETDENGKIKITYENRVQNIIIQLKDVAKEGIFEFQNSRVIGASAQITENTIPTQVYIKGINAISTEVEKEDGEKATETSDLVKYERNGQINTEIKQAVSNIDVKLDKDTLVNNTQNDVIITAALRTDGPQYSLFKNPTISIEMPAEVENINIGTPEILYDNQVFNITNSKVSTNNNGNKVINIQLQGSQTSYGQSSVVEGTNIRIPATINVTKQLESKVGIIKYTYSNEMTSITESKETEITLLNKVINLAPQIYTTGEQQSSENNGQNTNTSVFEKDGVKVEIIEEVGTNKIPDDGTVYEEQIIKHNVKVTNNNTTSKKVNLTINVPDEMTYVKLETGGSIKNQEKGYYEYSDTYEYKPQENKQIKIELDVNAGETKTDFIELKVNDLNNDVQEKQTNINYDLQINGGVATQFNVQNTIKQAEVSVELQCLLGINTRRSWIYRLLVTNLTDKELKDIKIAFEATPGFEIKDVQAMAEDIDGDNVDEGTTGDEEINEDEISEEVEEGKEDETGSIEVGIAEGNVWSYTMDKLNAMKTNESGEISDGFYEFIITGKMGDIEEPQNGEYEMNGISSISVNNSTYLSNETRMTGYIEAIDVSMISDKESLKADEEITYTVNIKNTGKTFGEFSTYTSVNVQDIIPRELEPISITYNEFNLEEKTVQDEEFSDLEHTVQVFTEQEVTEDLSVLEIPEGYDEEDAPNVNQYLLIPEGKTITMTIKAKAKELDESTKITNTMLVTGNYIKDKTSSVTTTILKDGDSGEPVNPDNPDQPDKPDQPDNPDNPNNPNNPDNPENPSKSKISISGIAWIDENEDGKRTTNEKTYSNMTVMLYDYKNNTFVKENNENKKVQTNSNGEYEFTNIDKGQYIVVFLYDTSAYTLTEYQKDGVIESKNSDVITKTIGIDGNTVTAGLTNSLTANSDLTNVDIGLIEKRDFDLGIKKYISKITVQTNDGKTKTYTYDNKQFAKAEIHSKKINGATVIIEYKMVITNNGEIDGKAVQIVDKLPDGLKFKSELNKNWYESNGNLYTNSLSQQTIGVGESKEVSLVLTKDVNSNNVGTVTNIASIGMSNNDKAVEDGNAENNSSNAQVIIGVATGLMRWLGITIFTIVVLAILAILIWKDRKILKRALFVIVFAICLVGNMQQVYGVNKHIKIRGVLVNGQIKYAKGDDGKIYHCNQKGNRFCNQWHSATLIKTKNTKTYTSSWKTKSGVTTIKLKNNTGETNTSELDDKNNIIGPFKINCNVSTTEATIKIKYGGKEHIATTVDSNGKALSIGDLKGDKEFYIKIGNDVTDVEYIKVTGKQTIKDYKYRTYKNTTTYIYDTKKLSPDYCPIKANNVTQDMKRTESKSGKESKDTTISKTITIPVNYNVKGDLIITKVDYDNESIVQKNVEFNIKNADNKYMSISKNGTKVEKIVANEIVLDENGNATINGETGYKVEFNSSPSTITTDTTGKIAIMNLQCGEYTIYETANNNYGFTKMITRVVDGMSPSEPTNEVIKNEKQVGDLHIIKVGKSSEGAGGIVEVDETEDENQEEERLEGIKFKLKADDGSGKKYVKIKGSAAEGDQIEKGENGWIRQATGEVRIDDTDDIINNPTYTYTTEDDATVFITNVTGEIKINNLLKQINGQTIKYYLQEGENSSYAFVQIQDDLEISDIEKTQKVTNISQVGEIDITKKDETTGKTLPGVEFVIKSSASNNDYIRVKATVNNENDEISEQNGLLEKYDDGWTKRAVGTVAINDTNDTESNPTLEYTSDINKATRFVTDNNGELHIQNVLAKDKGGQWIKYQLQEVANPNYGYLVNKTLNKVAYNVRYEGKSVNDSGLIEKLEINDTLDIIAYNHQTFTRLEGMVWEEQAIGKDNKIDNMCDETDALVEGINVYLYRLEKQVAQTTTNENGWYQFGTKLEEGEAYTDDDYVESNGDLLIDYLDEYHVEFEYDGLRFTSVDAIIEYLNNEYDKTSKAKEIESGRDDGKDRATVNNDFATITNNRSTGYDLSYTFENHRSTYQDKWGYEYNTEHNRLKVTPAKYYEIIASTKNAGFSLKTAWEKRCKETGAESITGINLGIKRREQADLALSSDLNTVDIKINTGSETYMNTYTYAKREIEDDKNDFGIETKFGTSSGSYSNRGLNLYTRRIYESDLAYNNNNNNKELMQIYVTYKIRVKNQSTELTSKVNEIANYFDKRYDVESSWIESESKKNTPVEWKVSNSNVEGYKVAYTNTIAGTEIKSGEYIDIYIKFKLNNKAVSELIQTQTTLNNVSEITSFSTITGKGENSKPYAAIDEDSNPGSAEIKLIEGSEPTETTLHGRTYYIENNKLDTTTYEDDTDMAPSLVLGIEEDNPTRGLSGTVFEDENIKYKDNDTHPGEERLGNGEFDNGERGVQNVKVELLNENDEIVDLYKYSIMDGELVASPVQAVTHTDEDGNYKFTGVIPGRYKIRYTYGDNVVSEIKDCEEKEIVGTSTQIGDNTIDARDYKSTIITSDLIKNALSLGKDPERMGDLNWILTYEDENGEAKSKSTEVDGLIRYSAAMDDMETREKMDNENMDYSTYIGKTNSKMTSDTAFFDVRVEYNSKVEKNNPKEPYTKYEDEYNLENGKIVVLDEENKIKLIDKFYSINPYQDFGIIERPRKTVQVNKMISNLKVTLANGQILINGNPYSEVKDLEKIDDITKLESTSSKLPYVKALPSQVNAEIDSEIIQGAKLELEYTISIKNKSEKDYKEKEYYYYGSSGKTEVEMVIKQVVDYMEDSLVYDEEQNNKCYWGKVTPGELYPEDGNTKQLIAKDVYDNIKQGYTIAITKAFYNNGNGIKIGKVASTKIYGSKILSASEKGTTVTNHTEIIQTLGRKIAGSIPGNYNPKVGEPNEPDDDKTTLQITGPTGLTDNKIFVILVTATALLVLAGGVYIIKKKIV